MKLFLCKLVTQLLRQEPTVLHLSKTSTQTMHTKRPITERLTNGTIPTSHSIIVGRHILSEHLPDLLGRVVTDVDDDRMNVDVMKFLDRLGVSRQHAVTIL